MIAELTGFQIWTLIFNLIVAVLGSFALRKLWELDCFKQGLIAHAKAAPVPPTAQLIAQWEKAYDSLPEHTAGGMPHPKKAAYRNRLIEVGVLNKNGEKIVASGD